MSSRQADCLSWANFSRGDERAILFPDPLSLHQHRQAFVETQVTALRLLLLFQPGLGQAVEFHGVEFVQSHFGQHGFVSQG